MNFIIKTIEDKEVTEINHIVNLKVFEYNLDELLNKLSGDIYNKRYGRYILLKLNCILSGNSSTKLDYKNISIEHILPQNPKENSDWCKSFSKEEREECTDKLGNLIVIGRIKNINLSNLDFPLKKEKYFAKNIDNFPHSTKIMADYDVWEVGSLKQNHRNMIDILKKYYEL